MSIPKSFVLFFACIVLCAEPVVKMPIGVFGVSPSPTDIPATLPIVVNVALVKVKLFAIDRFIIKFISSVLISLIVPVILTLPLTSRFAFGLVVPIPRLLVLGLNVILSLLKTVDIPDLDWKNNIFLSLSVVSSYTLTVAAPPTNVPVIESTNIDFQLLPLSPMVLFAPFGSMFPLTVKLVAVAAPKDGVVNEGLLANTSAPEPVSSLMTPANSDEVVAAKTLNLFLV